MKRQHVKCKNCGIECIVMSARMIDGKNFVCAKCVRRIKTDAMLRRMVKVN